MIVRNITSVQLLLRNNPAKSSYDEKDDAGVIVGTWTLTWSQVTATMQAGGVQFVGTWTFAKADEFPVEYRYVNGSSRATNSYPKSF